MDEKVGVEIILEGDVAIVAFKATSIINPQGIAAVSERIEEFIEKNHPNKLIFDFELVKFFSSQVLGLILQSRAKLQTNKGEVVISAIEPQLYRVFKITNLDKIFRFFPDRNSAIKAVTSN